jgi:hypothetical protein
MLVYFYQITRRHIPENSTLYFLELLWHICQPLSYERLSCTEFKSPRLCAKRIYYPLCIRILELDEGTMNGLFKQWICVVHWKLFFSSPFVACSVWNSTVQFLWGIYVIRSLNWISKTYSRVHRKNGTISIFCELPLKLKPADRIPLHYSLNKIPSLVIILSQPNPIRTTPTYFSKTHFSIILSTLFMSS